MTHKPLEKNIRLKLGLLEAKAGKKASVSWCASAVKNRKFAKKLDSIIGGEADPEAQISALRRQKVETKFHHTRCKALVKSMKNVKKAAVQKTVKRIKQLKTENKEGEELGHLEAELNAFKALDHSKMSDFAFYHFVLKDEYLQSKLGSIGMTSTMEERKESTKMQLSAKIVSSKSFQDAVKAERQDLTIFFKKMFHEPVPRSARPNQSQNVSKSSITKPGSSSSKAESFFVSSLNASDSDGDVSDADSFVGVRSSALVFTDDEEDDASDFEESDAEAPKPKKKKNRLGQLARRRLAEKIHGQNAKHLQDGGLSVKQREERRQERIVQKRARESRIKKAKAEAAEAKKNQSQTEQSKAKLDPSLHPSWAAKLQNQNRINASTFQGQKIKFGDDESKEEVKTNEKQKSTEKKKIESKPKKPFEAKKQSEAPKLDPKLHPSWAAKLQQQLKTNATAFQGQKIKFDDDE